MISKDKQYRTRDGREVRIYATDGGSGTQVHGAVANDGWQLCATEWNKNGKHMTSPNYDLIEVKPRHKRTVWIQVYPDHFHTTDYDATLTRFPSCIACIKVDLDFEEGEGL
jgi:hypothetical protein